MAYAITDKPNTEAPSADYPFGNIKDTVGATPGTPVNKLTYADFHQFFAKMMDWAEVTANGLPDNEYSGFQLFEAFMKAKPYKVYVAKMTQSGTGAPTAVVMENTIGNIVWSRNGAGDYVGTLAGAFSTTDKLWAIVGRPSNTRTATVFYNTANSISLIVQADAGAGADSSLSDTPIEIRVYKEIDYMG